MPLLERRILKWSAGERTVEGIKDTASSIGGSFFLFAVSPACLYLTLLD